MSEGSRVVSRLAGLLRGWRGNAPSSRDLALFPERNAAPVLLCGRDGTVAYANPAARRALGASALPLELNDPLGRLWGSGDAETTFVWATGGRLFSGRAVLSREREVAHVYLSDVTEGGASAEDAAGTRGLDLLTGLGNRVAFEARLDQALLDRPDGRVVVLLLNLDRLRRVNESLGHAAGDELLRESAARLRRRARDLGGEAFRFEGDTFAVLLATAEEDAAPVRLAGAVQESFQGAFAPGGRELFVTASVGISVAPGDGMAAPALLRAAEVALDEVKRGGGNGFRCYSAALDSMAREFLEVESALHRAVERGQLFLAYQTQVDLKTRRETGREALLRWRHPERGVVPPDRFLPVAEEAGLMAGIGAWATREACRAAAAWHGEAGDAPRLAVNVSAPELGEPRFAEALAAIIRETGLPPRRLEIEITESAAMKDPKAVASTLRRLKDTGVGIAIDDFGTGYSSLSYLSRFPADRIKIDRSFVAALGATPEVEGIVRAVIEIGHRLGMKVLAEGVEEPAQAESLRTWGCDEAQGFLFGRPAEDRADGP